MTPNISSPPPAPRPQGDVYVIPPARPNGTIGLAYESGGKIIA